MLSVVRSMQKCNKIIGRIHSIETLGALDGPGLRYIVFMQGCGLRCQYCHNPDTWDLSAGIMTTVEDQVTDILRYRNYLSGGVTISGGEPLLQPDFVYALIRECHKRAKIHCAIDTSGAVPLEQCINAVSEADMILLDIKAFSDSAASELTGSDTRSAWNILDYCEQNRKSVWIRHVLVPGKTLYERDESNMLFDSEDQFLAANPQLLDGAAKLCSYNCIEHIDLLPFHKMGEFKWEEMGVLCKLKETPEPNEMMVEWSRKLFSKISYEKRGCHE
jgi:pyruvate formate lyase activating enzyme